MGVECYNFRATFGMTGKTFRDRHADQVFLLRPSLGDFVPEDHPARIVRKLVEEVLDLSSIMRSQSDARGQPPCDPRMMVALLFDAYSQEIYSSREIARCCYDRTDFMAVTACQRPDFRTVNAFRKRHLSSLGDFCSIRYWLFAGERILRLLAMCRLTARGFTSGERVEAQGDEPRDNVELRAVDHIFRAAIAPILPASATPRPE